MIRWSVILAALVLAGCATQEYASEVDRILAEEQLCTGLVDTQYELSATVWSSDGATPTSGPAPSASSRCITDPAEIERVQREQERP
ncbi:hypothetical protein [Ferrimonas marina]|uniref:Lipoprotein n=1 Tax=Ferrimonas marina TaxID=299255 RepID=A0A1M5ZEX0_9GAMM|nr:hypothetical protein [Ferrimonas marina]SHI22709.1 hypothetical protein SAMN02745129_0174 [Ferrimonas marina]